MTQEECNKSRSNYFACVLYPNEDKGHSELIRYCSLRPAFSICYIEHEPDNETSKPHMHAIIKTPDRITLNSFLKYFAPWLKYAEPVHSLSSYIMYMLHDTPTAMLEGKRPYSVDSLQGDSKMWRGVVQNSHFMYFNRLFEFYSVGDTLLDLIHTIEISCEKNEVELLLDYIHKSSFLIISVLNQENNKYKERR